MEVDQEADHPSTWPQLDGDVVVMTCHQDCQSGRSPNWRVSSDPKKRPQPRRPEAVAAVERIAWMSFRQVSLNSASWGVGWLAGLVWKVCYRLTLLTSVGQFRCSGSFRFDRSFVASSTFTMTAPSLLRLFTPPFSRPQTFSSSLSPHRPEPRGRAGGRGGRCHPLVPLLGPFTGEGTGGKLQVSEAELEFLVFCRTCVQRRFRWVCRGQSWKQTWPKDVFSGVEGGVGGMVTLRRTRDGYNSQTKDTEEDTFPSSQQPPSLHSPPEEVGHHGSTPLHLAAESDAPGVVATLLEAKAEPQLGDDQGDTALHCDPALRWAVGVGGEEYWDSDLPVESEG